MDNLVQLPLDFPTLPPVYNQPKSRRKAKVNPTLQAVQVSEPFRVIRSNRRKRRGVAPNRMATFWRPRLALSIGARRRRHHGHRTVRLFDEPRELVSAGHEGDPQQRDRDAKDAAEPRKALHVNSPTGFVVRA